MLDVSWGELFVVTGLGFALIGKKDLPKAAGFVGNRIGRIVGLLQGARARADTFAQQTELKQLHNELKSGLRELDVVKSEMAIAMSSRAGGTGSLNMANRTVLSSSPQTSPQQFQVQTTTAMGGITAPQNKISPNTTLTASIPTTTTERQQRALPPKSQTIAAVAEEEWSKQGIGFRSRAERGVGLGYSDEAANNPLNSGSSILAHLYQQNLIFDQYDRVTQEHDDILQNKMDDIQAKRSAAASKQQSPPPSPNAANKK